MTEPLSETSPHTPAADARPGHGAGPFVDAVLAQLARGIDEAGAGAQQQVDALSDRLTSLLLACEQRDDEAAISILLQDALLLSVAFQNIDLLYSHDYPHADRVSMLILDAVHRAVEAEQG